MKEGGGKKEGEKDCFYVRSSEGGIVMHEQFSFTFMQRKEKGKKKRKKL